MKKVQLTLTDEEVRILRARAQDYGYNLHRFVQFIVAKEVTKNLDQQRKSDYVTNFRANVATERRQEFTRKFQADGWE